MNIRNVPLHLLRPYEKNAKKHPVMQLEGIAQSIKQFGFKQPIVIDINNVIVAGHGRYEAAATLGIEEVPCVVADDLSKEQIRAYRILDNKLSESGMDLDILAIDMNDLDFDFAPFGVFTDNTFLNQSDSILDNDNAEKGKKLVTCPSCNHEFVP